MKNCTSERRGHQSPLIPPMRYKGRPTHLVACRNARCCGRSRRRCRLAPRAVVVRVADASRAPGGAGAISGLHVMGGEGAWLNNRWNIFASPLPMPKTGLPATGPPPLTCCSTNSSVTTSSMLLSCNGAQTPPCSVVGCKSASLEALKGDGPGAASSSSSSASPKPTISPSFTPAAQFPSESRSGGAPNRMPPPPTHTRKL